MRKMTDDDLAQIRRAVQFRERCVKAALAHHERVELRPDELYARATFDAVEALIRADERERIERSITVGEG